MFSICGPGFDAAPRRYSDSVAVAASPRAAPLLTISSRWLSIEFAGRLSLQACSVSPALRRISTEMANHKGLFS